MVYEVFRRRPGVTKSDMGSDRSEGGVGKIACSKSMRGAGRPVTKGCVVEFDQSEKSRSKERAREVRGREGEESEEVSKRGCLSILLPLLRQLKGKRERGKERGDGQKCRTGSFPSPDLGYRIRLGLGSG